MSLRRIYSENCLSASPKATETKKITVIQRSHSYPSLIKIKVPARLEEEEIIFSPPSNASENIEEEKAILTPIERKIMELKDSSEQNILRKLIEVDYLVFTLVGVFLPSTVDQGSIYWNWIDGALSAGVGVHQLWKSRNYTYYKRSTQLKGVVNFLSGMQSLALSTSVFCHALPVWGPYLAFSISMLCDFIELSIDFYHICCLKAEANGQEKKLTELLEMYEQTRNNLIAKACGLAGAIFLTVAAFHVSALTLTMIGTILGGLTAAYYLFKHGEKTETGKYLKQKVTSCASSFFHLGRGPGVTETIISTPRLAAV